MKRVHAILLLCTVTLLLGNSLPAAEWPEFHGPDRSNRSPAAGLLNAWPQKGPRLLWTAEGCGEGFATVAIAGNRLYTAGRKGDAMAVVAFDRRGTKIWETDNGSAWSKGHPGSRATPTIAGGRCYHLSGVGRLVCLDAASGRPIWNKNILEVFGAENIQWGLAESVLVTDGKVVCTPGGRRGAVVALDPDTGKTLWAMDRVEEKAGYCSPVRASIHGTPTVVTLLAESVVGVELATGRLLWRFPHKTKYDVNCATPIVRGDRVLVSTGYGSGSVLLRIQRRGNRWQAGKVWENKQLDNHHGGLVYDRGRVYGTGHATGKGAWFCLDFDSGRAHYRERGIGKGTATYADGMLYCLSERGVMALVPANPKAFQPVSRFTLPKQGKGPFWAHPVVLDGRLYVRHGDFLYAYDVAAKK